MNGIILEGVDGAGKTTLANIIAAKRGWDICHCTADDPADYDFYRNTARKKNIIWDRHTIGELIYPTVFLRDQKIAVEDARIVIDVARKNNICMFILTADLADIERRLTLRGNEDKMIWDNLKYINDRFLFYAEAFNIPVLNTSLPLDYNHIFNYLEEDFT